MGKIEFANIPLSSLELNEGQVEGLPKNPRCWTYDDLIKLQNSIQQTPELLDARGILAYPYNGKYVAIGGNMRLSALRNLGVSDAPCAILPVDMSIETLKQITIKDNGSWGKWNEAKLKNDWSEVNFAEWGIDVFVTDEQPEEKPNAKIEDGTHIWTVTFSSDEFDFVNKSLRDLNPSSEEALLTILGYYDRVS